MCDLAAGFWEEHSGACFASDKDDVDVLASSHVLRAMHRKRKTLHENSVQQVFSKSGLSCPIPVDYVELPDGYRHEIFRVESFLRTFSLNEKLHLFLGHVQDFSLTGEYWRRVKCIDPGHPVFSYHEGREQYVIPCCLHADEGRTLKKSSIMVCNLQPELGGNPDPEYDPQELHTNMKFISWATRFLIFTMHKSIYRKDSAPLYKMWESLAAELLHLWTHGVELIWNNAKITVFICVTAIKGDWPLLAKLGCLERFFGRKTKDGSKGEAKGICHLCLAGQKDCPFHDCTPTALWRSTFLQHDPFWKPSPFACLPYHQPLLYRFDIFHVCHKGVLAELAGSGLVAGCIWYMLVV